MWRPERDADPWTTGEHLLALLAERVDYWGRKHALAQGWKRHQLPDQLRIPRPGEQQQRKKVETDPRAIAAFFSRHIGGG